MLHYADLHADQHLAIQHIHAYPRTGVWMRMGGGKTVSTLTALDQLSHVEDVWPALILAPLRVAASTWPNEPSGWSHLRHLKVQAVVGTAKEREAALRIPANAYSINYDNLVWLVEHFGDRWPFKTIVADEASKLKSMRLRQGGKRTQALAKVAWTKVDRFVELTGTPSANGLIDLWGQLWFLDKGERLGRTFSAFEQRWFKTGYDGFSVQPLAHTQTEIQDRIRDIRVTLPGQQVDEPILNDIMIDLPTAARRLYNEMEREMYVEIEEKGVEALNAAAKTSKIMQIAAGSLIHDTDSGAWTQVHDVKLDALESVVEESGGMPVLVAYQFKADLARILKRFPKAKHLDSDPKTIERWNKGEIPMLVAHPKSAGHGISLQHGGNIMVFFSAGWALEDYQQIIERIGPMRQKQSGYDRPVYVHRIVARRTVDELVIERLESKRSVQDILLAALERRKKDKAA